MAKVPFEAEKAAKRRKIRDAMAWLQGAMIAGPRPAAEVEAEAMAAGHTHTTLQTARARLHITSHRQGNQWIWTPPRTRQKQHTH